MALTHLLLVLTVGSVSGDLCDDAQQNCPADPRAEATSGRSLLQMPRQSLQKVISEEGGKCNKKWCYSEQRSGHLSWPEKCEMGRCEGCSECDTTTTTTMPLLPVCQVNGKDEVEIPSGSAFKGKPSAPTDTAGATFALEAPPAGLGVNMRSGVLTWQPDISQAGSHYAVLKVMQPEGTSEKCLVQFSVTASGSNPSGIYVSPSTGSDTSGAGTVEAPFASVEHAAGTAGPGDVIYIRGGSYPLSMDEVVVEATAAEPVVITRLPGEHVTFTVQTGKIGFKIPTDSVGVTFRGLELYGATETNDHWEVLRTSFWGLEDTRVGGKTGFEVDGQHVVIEDCVIHDFFQKGVNIYKGRYVTVRHNIIYNIGHSSLSGGHGIMRKWERNFKDADDPEYFRFDFYGNLIVGVEQRIYSFIPWKGYCEMVIDEGKGILIDITKDKDMKARIAHNLVLFGGVDHIRLKWNPNLEVHNNAIMTEEGRTDPIPDGITCKNNMAPSPNMTLIGNLVQSFAGSHPFDANQHFTADDYPGRIRGNYYAGGGEAVGDLQGVSDLGAAASVFKDAANLDFRKADSIEGNAGVDPAILEKLMSMASELHIPIAPSGWQHDHKRNVDTIVLNAPSKHLRLPPKLEESKKSPGHQALYFKVKSEWYKDYCKCEELEFVLPPYLHSYHLPEM